jgi:hypothetical protein
MAVRKRSLSTEAISKQNEDGAHSTARNFRRFVDASMKHVLLTIYEGETIVRFTPAAGPPIVNWNR